MLKDPHLPILTPRRPAPIFLYLHKRQLQHLLLTPQERWKLKHRAKRSLGKNMTLAEFEVCSELLLGFLQETRPALRWRKEVLDCGYTHEFSTLVGNSLKGIGLHAWSWNGHFNPADVIAFIDKGQPDTIYHLSDPTRPDHVKSRSVK